MLINSAVELRYLLALAQHQDRFLVPAQCYLHKVQVVRRQAERLNAIYVSFQYDLFCHFFFSILSGLLSTISL